MYPVPPKPCTPYSQSHVPCSPSSKPCTQFHFLGQIAGGKAWFRGYRVHSFELGVRGIWSQRYGVPGCESTGYIVSRIRSFSLPKVNWRIFATWHCYAVRVRGYDSSTRTRTDDESLDSAIDTTEWDSIMQSHSDSDSESVSLSQSLRLSVIDWVRVSDCRWVCYNHNLGVGVGLQIMPVTGPIKVSHWLTEDWGVSVRSQTFLF